MTYQAGQQIIIIHILSNILRSKGKQTIKFGQAIKYNVRNISLQKSCRRSGRETSFRPLFLKKVLYIIFLKVTRQHLSFNIFCWSLTWTYNKTNWMKFQAVDPILTFSKKVWDKPFHTILSMIFHENFFHGLSLKQTKTTLLKGQSPTFS